MLSMYCFQVRVETYTGLAEDKTNRTVTTKLTLPLSTTVHDIKNMRIWKKKDGIMTSLQANTFTLSYQEKEITDSTMLAEIAVPGQPVTFKVERISITVFSFLNNREYHWILPAYPSKPISIFKGLVYGYSSIRPATQHYRYCNTSQTGFDCTSFLSSNAQQHACTTLKECAVYPGDRLRLTEIIDQPQVYHKYMM